MVYQNLLILATFILLYSLFAKRIEKTIISGPVVALVIGILLGPLFLNLINIQVAGEEYRVIAELALALVLFTDASKTNLNVLKRNAGIPIRLLLIGLPLTIVFGMIAGLLIFKGFSWIEVGILATMLAPTDAALGKAVVTNEKVPSKIRESLNVESGLNDGISVPILFIFIAFITTQSGDNINSYYGLHLFVEEIGIGLLAGLGITFLIVMIARYSSLHNWISESWKPIIFIALSFSCFSAAQVAGGSGFIACFAGGFLYSAMSSKYKLDKDVVESAEGAGDTMSLLTWFIFGSIVIGGYTSSFSWEIVLYSVLSLTILRIVPVFISLINTGIPFKEKLFIGWFGPRGLATIVFAIIVLDNVIPHSSIIITTVVYTILLSVILHGITANPFIKLLNKK